MAGAAPTLCMVVVTRNREQEVRLLLESVSVQSLRPDEIVLIDSSDSSSLDKIALEILGNKRPNVQLVLAKCNLPTGRNIGFSKSRSDLVCFIDDDAVLDKDYFKAIVEFMQKSPTQGTGGVEGEITNAKSAKDLNALFHWSINALFYHSFPGKGYIRRSGRARPVFSSPRTVPVQVVSGSNMTFRREVLEEISFDETLEGRSQEDLDFSIRASKKWALYHLPGARLLHLEVAKARASSSVDAVSMVRNSRKIHRKSIEQTFRNRLAFKISLVGAFILLLIGRRVNDLNPFLSAVLEK